MIERARDEIVALRAALDGCAQDYNESRAGDRAEALEEAARVCETHFAASNTDGQYHGGLLATAIRALVDSE